MELSGVYSGINLAAVTDLLDDVLELF